MFAYKCLVQALTFATKGEKEWSIRVTVAIWVWRKVAEEEALRAKSINTRSSVSMDPHGHNEDLDSLQQQQSPSQPPPPRDLSAATSSIPRIVS